jgi:hypothetical protein
LRFGILLNEETDESIVEIYFRTILFYPIPNQVFKLDTYKKALISRMENLLDLEKKIQRFLNLRLYSLKEKSIMVNRIRLWKSLNNNMEDI